MLIFMTVRCRRRKTRRRPDIAKVGATQRRGYLRQLRRRQAVGHLLAEPHQIRLATLAQHPAHAPKPGHWSSATRTQDQFAVVRKVINDAAKQVIATTRVAREVIFRYIYEAAGCGKPIKRLWISSLTPDAIRKGFQTLRDGRYDPLADAARGEA
ncbi:MAG: hypothetical protein R3F37_09780 [Candidatus Competibacteraceae bacterium]